MSFDIMAITPSLIQKYAVEEIEKCNEYTARFGLTLSMADAVELAETRSRVLKNSGRIELGDGIVQKLIREFCDSPYISMHNYVETINELIEIFYSYKNETLDLLSDDELIEFMKKSFDGHCQGSLELLRDKVLANMARNLRYGYPPDYMEEPVHDGEDEYEDGEY